MPSFQFPITVPHGQWVRVIPANVESFMLQVTAGEVRLLRHDDQAPSGLPRGWIWRRGEGQRDLTLDKISARPSATLWAYGMAYPHSVVEVDYA